MLKIVITILLAFVVDICLVAQVNIDFFPKMLQNDLNKANGSSEVKELLQSPNVAGEIYLGKFYAIPSTSPIYKYAYVGRVKTCRAGGCSLKSDPKTDVESEYFDYYILFDSSLTVQLVKIYNYQATHGHEVSSKNWLKQFKGYKGDNELIRSKNVDAISGATISVDAISFDIFHKTGLIKDVVGLSS